MGLSVSHQQGNQSSQPHAYDFSLLIADDRLSKIIDRQRNQPYTKWWSAGREKNRFCQLLQATTANCINHTRMLLGNNSGLCLGFRFLLLFLSLFSRTATFTTADTLSRRSLNLLMQAGQPSVIDTPSQYHTPCYTPLLLFFLLLEGWTDGIVFQCWPALDGLREEIREE